MCKTLSLIYIKVLTVFPELEASRPRSTSGIQALCSLHIALEKTKTLLQHCTECSKIYLVQNLSSFHLILHLPIYPLKVINYTIFIYSLTLCIFYRL